MFGKPFLAALAPDAGQDFRRLVEEHARPRLHRDGGWMMDYRRLRIMAVKPALAAAGLTDCRQ